VLRQVPSRLSSCIASPSAAAPGGAFALAASVGKPGKASLHHAVPSRRRHSTYEEAASSGHRVMISRQLIGRQFRNPMDRRGQNRRGAAHFRRGCRRGRIDSPWQKGMLRLHRIAPFPSSGKSKSTRNLSCQSFLTPCGPRCLSRLACLWPRAPVAAQPLRPQCPRARVRPAALRAASTARAAKSRDPCWYLGGPDVARPNRAVSIGGIANLPVAV
jgi:hypothetical protein